MLKQQGSNLVLIIYIFIKNGVDEQRALKIDIFIYLRLVFPKIDFNSL